MPMPDNSVQEVRASVLKYIQQYEQGGLSMGDLRAELAAMAPGYEHAMGAIDDHFSALLRAAESAHGFFDFETALTRFRRDEAAW
jgi:hypothetical protein